MPDDHVPAPTPPSPTGFHSSPAEGRPTEYSNGEANAHIQSAPRTDNPATGGGKMVHSALPELAFLLRWVLGLLLVLGCGWGLLGLAFYLTRSHVKSPELAFGVFAVFDLALFLFLEKGFWLSRFMGLRIEPNSHPWHSAIMLWLLGVPGLLFRSTNFHPETATALQPSPQSRPKQQPVQHSDSVREIVETIVFVVVLVLLLKSFAAEAFVIPTGSMAQTLLGYQKEVVCPDCGIKFPINCSQEVDPNEGGRPSPVYACVCPNCRQRIHFPSAPPHHLRDFPDSIQIDDPGWNSGDRVLVAKFVYDLLGKSPDRLDVVVFKYPGDGSFPASGPHKNHVPMNYIKRLIGLPGETIAIRGGKLYVLSPDAGLRYNDYDKARLEPDLMATLWQKDHMHINDREAIDRFEQGQFQIIRKSPENILSMMRLVYDNDHPSRKVSAEIRERWLSPDRAWTPHEPHGFRVGPEAGPEMHWLRYKHLLRDNDGHPALITDIMGYNTYQGGPHTTPLLGNNWVGDLIVECEATIEAPQGEFTLELSRGVDRFRARWDLSTGVCTLLRVTNGEEKELGSKPTAMNKKGDYRLRFANVDERLLVWVDGELPFDTGLTYSAPADLGPREKNDFEPASIGVRGGAVAVHKVRLFRDTYYTVGGDHHDRPNDPDVAGVVFTDPDTWRGLRNPPVLTLYVQPDHFLCLGDNSPESSDGRSWGAVPRRLLLGRALLVYYPFGRAGRIR
jgi:signal peptidase I